MCLYVREITLAEGRKLQNIIRRASNRIKMRRAQIIMASAQGSKVSAIAERLYFSDQHIRAIIKDFNATGFEALVPKYGGGRPPRFSAEQRSLIVETALCPPDFLGQPFMRWSLAKLRDFMVAEKVVTSISIETIRQILRANKVKLRRTKTWKECNDPKLRSKKK